MQVNVQYIDIVDKSNLTLYCYKNVGGPTDLTIIVYAYSTYVNMQKEVPDESWTKPPVSWLII